uniref:Integrin_alpha2 domain-containing protein n=1 Tax=Syphacia muris TaxID=451379 RepID=A0A158R647_9BILA
MVGAPTGGSAYRREGVQLPGAIYKCMVNKPACSEVHFDDKGNTMALHGKELKQIDEKTRERLGSTVVSSQSGDKFVVCAPHYTHFSPNFRYRDPVGRCFYADRSFNNFTEFAPCLKKSKTGFFTGFHRLGFGMCGHSAAIPEHMNRLYVSAPGAYYLQGTIFSQNIEDKTDQPNIPVQNKGFDDTFMGILFENNQFSDVFFFSFMQITLLFLELIRKKRVSTAVGRFDGDGKEDVVTGVPRLNDCGTVRIFDASLKPLKTLYDEDCQIGQQLGTAVAVTDLNNDGLDDIIAGAPFYTAFGAKVNDKTHEKKPKYVIGKVVVFFQKSKDHFTAQTIYGEQEWSRFGYSVAAVGDLNQDGFNGMLIRAHQVSFTDFIVGAPYGGSDGGGAVYVFHGSNDGVRPKPAQIIEGRSIGKGIRTFGFAVAGGKDIDNNQYPDIAVGAFETSHAAVLRTRPVVRVISNVEMSPPSVNLEKRTCSTPDGDMTWYQSRDFVNQWGKTLTYRPKAPDEVTLKVIIQLDLNVPSKKRAFFIPTELYRKSVFHIFDVLQEKYLRPHKNAVFKMHPDAVEGTIRLRKGEKLRKRVTVYVSNTIRDKLTPITVSLNYTLVEANSRRSNELDPALDTTVQTVHITDLWNFKYTIFQLNIDKNCGKDEKCIPDLSLLVIPNKEKFTIGGVDEKLVLNVTVENRGEDAYESQFFITIPPQFEYNGVVSEDGKSVPCDKIDGIGYEFQCDLGNPIPGRQTVKFQVHLTTSRDRENYFNDDIVIRTVVNSTNEEAPGHDYDNSYNVTLAFETKAQLILNSKSEPPEVAYSIRNRTLLADSYADESSRAKFDSEIGPLVTHVFQVYNNGPSSIQKANLDIIWPSHYSNSKYLLYLIDEPRIDSPGQVTCGIKPVENMNPEGLLPSFTSWENPAQMSSGSSQNTNAGWLPDQYTDYAIKRSVRETYGSDSDDDTQQLSAEYTQRLSKFKKELNQNVNKGKQYRGVAFVYHGNLSRSSIMCPKKDCTHISCDIQKLKATESVVIYVYSRLVLNTAIEAFTDVDKSYEVSSLAIAEIVEMPFKSDYKPPKQMLAVTTILNPTDPEKSKESIPWWLILIAILIGLLILLLLILCLWRCGFFKRKRPPTEHAVYNTGNRNQDTFADSQMRYAHPYMYNEGKHGTRL